MDLKGTLIKGIIVRVNPDRNWTGSYREYAGKEFEITEYVDNFDGRFYISPFKVSMGEVGYRGLAIYRQTDLEYVRDGIISREHKTLGPMPLGIKFVLWFLCIALAGQFFLLADSIAGNGTPVSIPFSMVLIAFLLIGIKSLINYFKK